MKVILKNAKTDVLAKVLKRVMKEPDVRAIFNANKAALKKAFDARSNAAIAATKAPTMSLESLLGAMNERHVAKDAIVHPTPAQLKRISLPKSSLPFAFLKSNCARAPRKRG